MNKISYIFILILIVSFCLADTYYIDTEGNGDYTNIQFAINAANNGDILILVNQTYSETNNTNINWSNKDLTIQSQNGADNCVISCAHNQNAFSLFNGSSGTINGITFTGGSYNSSGMIYYCSINNEEFNIQNCVFENVHSDYVINILSDVDTNIGSGILIENNEFSGCSSNHIVKIWRDMPLNTPNPGGSTNIRNNLFINNTNSTAINTADQSPSKFIVNNTFYHNLTGINSESDIISVNNIFYDNYTAIEDNEIPPEFSCFFSNNVDVSDENFGTGCIFTNPLFISGDEKFIAYTSPCRASGNSQYGQPDMGWIPYSETPCNASVTAYTNITTHDCELTLSYNGNNYTNTNQWSSPQYTMNFSNIGTGATPQTMSIYAEATGPWADNYSEDQTTFSYDYTSNKFVGSIHLEDYRESGDIEIRIDPNHTATACNVELYDGSTKIKGNTDDWLDDYITIDFKDVSGISEVENLTVEASGRGPWGNILTQNTTSPLTYLALHDCWVNSGVLSFTYTDNDIDTKQLHETGWNWVSFPRLPDRDINGEYDAITLFTPLIPDFDQAQYYDNEDCEYDYLSYNGSWLTQRLTDIESTRGYKIYMGDEENSYIISGEMVDESTSFNLYAGRENWISYFMVDAQNIEDAFGSDWDKVVTVKAEDWIYDISIPDRSGTSQMYPWSTTGKNLHYGKGYVVEVDENIIDFQWNDPNGSGGMAQSTKTETEYFTYEEKADYEAICIENIDPSIQEVAVFEGNVCVGASVVESNIVTILTYTSEANRNELPLTFQIYNGNRNIEKIKEYFVYNNQTKEFSLSYITGREKTSSLIRFNNDTEDTIDIYNEYLLLNYPNPFVIGSSSQGNTTTIKFNISNPQLVSLSIFNIKGEKIVTLLNGQVEAGLNQIDWNGEDNNGKYVATGIYLYKLKTEHQILSKKMLILK